MHFRRAKWALIPLSCLILSSCIILSAPPQDVEFHPVENLSAFEGVFRNRGESERKEHPVYLSSLIWHSHDIPHCSITTIDVRLADANSLAIKAFRGGKIEKEDIFVEGRDFSLPNGRIRLKRQWALLNAGGDDPLVGPRYETCEIGLDVRGDGKYRAQINGAGLIFLLFPVAISASEEVRFIRLEP